MSNALESHDAKSIQRARARHLRELFEPWTYRKLEARTGLGRSTLQSRMTGETPMTMPDFEVLAPVIRMTPEALFAELLKIKLPEVDSNHQPAGSTLRLLPSVADRRHRPEPTPHTRPADVLPFPKRLGTVAAS